MPHEIAFVGDLKITRKASPIFFTTCPLNSLKMGIVTWSKNSWNKTREPRVLVEVRFVKPATSMNMIVAVSDGMS